MKWRVASGRMHRVYRGVYSVGHTALSREGMFMAAVLAVGDDAVIGGEAAAELWILTRQPAQSIDVIVPRRHHGLSGIDVHEARGLAPNEISRRRGIPVTSVSRTLVDLADHMTAYQLANLMHEAAFRRRMNIRTIRRVMARHRTRKGHAALVKGLALHRAGSAGVKSELESQFIALMEEGELPEPQVNVHVEVGGRTFEVDFHWPKERLCVEVDGSGHLRARTREEDRARDAALKAAGYRVMRVTGGMVEKRGALVQRRVRKALSDDSAALR
jgi:very-short-patch-repair endonuclease